MSRGKWNIYPYSVNSVKADFADPYANDQDWGLYFALRFDSSIVIFLTWKFKSSRA